MLIIFYNIVKKAMINQLNQETNQNYNLLKTNNDSLKNPIKIHLLIIKKILYFYLEIMEILI